MLTANFSKVTKEELGSTKKCSIISDMNSPLEELLNDLQALEPLEKACPRCGSPSANSSNSSGRCSKCLKKLKTNKKKPGHYLHEHKLSDDALRRQDGKTKTSSAKSSGRGNRKSLIRQIRAAYKKHGKGKTLSPDRKDNGKGYGAKNTRMVPKELNRGRHKVDSKKLKNWHKKVKKTDFSFDEFKTLLKAKALEKNDEQLLKHIESLTYQEFISLSAD